MAKLSSSGGRSPLAHHLPAIHQTRQDIGLLFQNKLPVDYTDNVDALIAIRSAACCQKFAEADIGLSGVNFAVAETGTLCLVENEGNGRLCTTAPAVRTSPSPASRRSSPRSTRCRRC